MAAKKKRKSGPSGPSGVSGPHKANQLLLDEGRTGQFAEWTQEAKRRGITRAELIRLSTDQEVSKKH